MTSTTVAIETLRPYSKWIVVIGVILSLICFIIGYILNRKEIKRLQNENDTQKNN